MRALLLLSRILAVTTLLSLSFPSFSQAPSAGGNVDTPDIRATKERLIRVINDLRTGSPNMNQFEPMLRIAVQQQKDRTDAYFAAMGKVKDVAFEGPQNGGSVFSVTFEHGVSAWWIQLAPNGNIAGLFFQ